MVNSERGTVNGSQLGMRICEDMSLFSVRNFVNMFGLFAEFTLKGFPDFIRRISIKNKEVCYE
jgi:hypothetical protein